jgi:hypothetical protein
MSTMLAEMYDALRDAGASEEKARAAATALAEQDTRQHKVEADLSLLKWMVGANIALTFAVVARTFFA